MRTFDAIIVGAGQAGPSLAGRLAAAGMTVALIERKFVGGTCVNAGCMPTKTLVASARTAQVIRRSAEYGIRRDGGMQTDMAAVEKRAATVINNARNSLTSSLTSTEGISLIRGHARFESAKTIRVGDETLTAPRIFLNVGARPVIPPLPGLSDIEYLTSTSIIHLTALPRHLAIIGAGYIGLEFAQMYRRFGTEVSIIERGPYLAPREDDDICQAIGDVLRAEGISIHKNAEDIRLSKSGENIRISTAGNPDVEASHLLIATGRRPNTDDLGLEKAGVALDSKGYIVVDDHLSTNVDGIWALGDCNGHGAFTHTSYNDFEIVAANLLDGEDRKVSERIPAYALYIDPPLGRVGITEKEARAKGRSVATSTMPMSRVGRAVEKGETQGLMKVVADVETGQILGAAIFGVEGDEAIHGFIDAMHARTPYPVLKWAVPIHPTVSELIPTLLGGLKSA
ncbi:FAD-containing oxidoreductase (plasmid) [Rhizobium sp. CB3090]|uniref:FAD-containing oxidoreductase n=1 Tax=Rhizobium sp. CB3090 TaxID=3039156 RepID=UPI0024B0C874|nr:FAD-containing oxidoreductase [Rhizobium sp. CB3090]WFU11455.1 FAD-containing oxidoreductase [Rhizobium sp. CB3090]